MNEIQTYEPTSSHGGMLICSSGGRYVLKKDHDAAIDRLTTENKRFRQERDDQFWARGHELKELIAARTALDEANRKYERAYDCHGQACGACIACCAEIIYDLTIRKDMAREDGYRQGWEHRKQVQDSFNEATIAVSRKFQEDLLKILTIVENDNDPDWSKVQKIKGIMLKHHIEQCPKHPMSSLRAELADLKDGLTAAHMDGFASGKAEAKEMLRKRDGQLEELRAEVKAYREVEDSLQKEIKRLDAEVERLRMQLAACGVAAMSD